MLTLEYPSSNKPAPSIGNWTDFPCHAEKVGTGQKDVPQVLKRVCENPGAKSRTYFQSLAARLKPCPSCMVRFSRTVILLPLFVD